MARAIAMRVFSTTTEMNQIIETAKAISDWISISDRQMTI